jgi:hypothetical protein
MKREPMESDSKRNFILQQGFKEPRPESCTTQFSALTVQPKIVALVLVLGIVFQSPWLFVALSATLWAGALFPRLNPYDALYRAVGGKFPLAPAPAPRRFSQGMAGTFAVAIGACLLLGLNTSAYVLEGFFAAAVIALSFGRLCLGSFLFHLLRGRASFAIRTLPWSKGE